MVVFILLISLYTFSCSFETEISVYKLYGRVVYPFNEQTSFAMARVLFTQGLGGKVDLDKKQFS